jgi:glycosyltransferase involved in cell wall biosynthesis
MRVLYYNWADYLDDARRGGGVLVYQRNLMAAMDARDDVVAGFFSSGLSYDLPAGPPRWEAVRHGPRTDRHRRWEIVNAAPLAPAHHSFGDPAQIEDRATEAAVCDLVAATGPWDVLHLNNLEGLPVAVLGRLKARFPGLRIVLSLHNHFPVCPQVNLWWQERSACTDFDGGRACVTCLPRMPDRRMLRLANGLAYRLKRAGLGPGTRAVRIGGRGMRALRRLRPPLSALTSGAPPAPARPDGAPFAARRSAMVAAINAHCDRVLCVSDAVRRIALRHGIAPDRAHVSYIGTAEAEAFARTAPRRVPRAADGTLTLGFLGYMRRDKGFHFLLDALESLPASLAARIRLVVAARRGNRATMARLAGLEARLASVDHADGYRHADLDRLLAPVDVGVIPVLWEDSLPQVAIEMHARHIPLLTADMGGARELGRCPDMVFPAGDTAAFRARLERLLVGGVDFGAYWAGAMPPVSLEAHAAALMRHYRG